MTDWSAQGSAERFEMACRESEKAWSQTGLLALTTARKAALVADAFARASAKEVAGMLEDMVGPSYASYAVQSGMDGNKAAELGRIVITLVASCGLQPGAGATAALSNADSMRSRMTSWILNGGGDIAALARIDALLHSDHSVRLALIASFAPAIAGTQSVLKALCSGFPFKSGQGVAA
jgi:hypothetical protein